MAGGRRVSGEDRKIAARIRSARAASGSTQLELARVLGVTAQQMTKYERAISRVSAGQLVSIARALGVPVAQFLGEDGTVSFVPRARVTAKLVRDFCALEADLQDVVLKVVRALALQTKHSSKRSKPSTLS